MSSPARSNGKERKVNLAPPSLASLAMGAADRFVEKTLGNEGKQATETTVPLALLDENPFQPRKHYDETAMEELVVSMREQGLLQRIVVAPSGADSKRYIIIFGHRRAEAARRLNWDRIEAKVYETVTAEQLKLFALVENTTRQDLTPFEIASQYHLLLEGVESAEGEEWLAKVTGRSIKTVNAYLGLLKLDGGVIQAATATETSFRRLKLLLPVKDVTTQLRYIELWSKGVNVEPTQEEKKKPAKPLTSPPPSPAPGSVNVSGFSLGKKMNLEIHVVRGKSRVQSFKFTIQSKKKEFEPVELRHGIAGLLARSYGEDVSQVEAAKRLIEELETGQS
jgi:ParB family transcriptional regulator, chromosome partitioning protein